MPEVGSYPPGAFCWIDLATKDLNATKGFYGGLFGWTFVDSPIGSGNVYSVCRLKGQDVASVYTLDPSQPPGALRGWMVYVATADADATAVRSAELGGAIATAGFEVKDLGRMAVLRDPGGAAFSVWQARNGPGLGIRDEHGAFCWGQLNTMDTEKAEAFYTSLFGWTAKTGSDGGHTYTEWLLAGRPIGGMMAMPPGGFEPPHWLAYFAVDDCDAIAAKAAALGATTCVRPTDIPGTGRFAVFMDQQGAAFAVYRAQA